jgi:hypothetical protein
MRRDSFDLFEELSKPTSPCPVFIRERLERLERLEELELPALFRRLERSNSV